MTDETEVMRDILEVLKAGSAETSLRDLVESLHAKGHRDDSRIKLEIWTLIAESVVELTDQRNLRVANRSERRYDPIGDSVPQ